MAVYGLSLAEREPYILKNDPGHPENLKKEFDTKVSAWTAKNESLPSQDERNAIESEVKRAAGDPTIFFVGNLRNEDRIRILDMRQAPTMKDGTISMTTNVARRNYELVQHGLKGWDNFMVPDDSAKEYKSLEFKMGTAQGSSFSAVASSDSMARLTRDMIDELAGAIIDKNGMGDALAKKFEAALLQQDDVLSEIGDAQPAQTNKSE